MSLPCGGLWEARAFAKAPATRKKAARAVNSLTWRFAHAAQSSEYLIQAGLFPTANNSVQRVRSEMHIRRSSKEHGDV